MLASKLSTISTPSEELFGQADKRQVIYINYISINLLYQFESDIVHCSGPCSELALAAVGPQIITNHSLKGRELQGDQRSPDTNKD